MPHGYFGTTATKVLDEFRETALSHPGEELIAAFPEVAMAMDWRAPGARPPRGLSQLAAVCGFEKNQRSDLCSFRLEPDFRDVVKIAWYRKI